MYLTCGSLWLWTTLGLETIAHLYFFLSRFGAFGVRPTRGFGVDILNYAFRSKEVLHKVVPYLLIYLSFQRKYWPKQSETM